MTQRIEAIEDNGGTLHLASLVDGQCLRVDSGWEHYREGTLRADMARAARDPWCAAGLPHQRYLELLGMGADIIAILDAEDDVLRYIDPKAMGVAGRRWLGEAPPSGIRMSVSWAKLTVVGEG